ncbi:hypothetical protein GF420_06080 [candidate division GN15 bacterium]|nr:hypothetical protein [candidate division GN15 bacterium]
MNYLDYSKFADLLARQPERFPSRSARLVGADCAFDSGFYDIVRFFGDSPVRADETHIEVLPGMFCITDPMIAEFARYVAERLRRQGRLYDGPTVTGVRQIEIDEQAGRVLVQETTYADFAGSCFALDLSHPLFEDYGGSLRRYYIDRYSDTPLQDRPLANCFGVCGYVLVTEGEQQFLLQIVRASHLATMAGTPGPSVAGSVDFAADYGTIGGLIDRALGQEVEEELHLTRDEFSLTPLACARELFRGDNPQLFALIRVNLSREDLAARMEAVPGAEREFASYQFLPLSDSRLTTDAIDGINFEARMAYYLAEEYLAARQ